MLNMQVTGKLHMVMTFSQMLVGNLHCSGNIRHDIKIERMSSKLPTETWGTKTAA